MSSIEQIGKQYENLYAIIGEEFFNQTAGLSFDAERLQQASQKMTQLCEQFLSKYTEPRQMYRASIEALARTAFLPHRLKLTEERLKLIADPDHKFKENPVTWASWRQFNAITKDATIRKAVFDHFVSQAPQLIPLVKNGFDAMGEVYTRFDSSPITNYLEKEAFSYDELVRFLSQLGEGARSTFLKTAEKYAHEIKNGPFEYYDDFYFFRSQVFRPLDDHFKGIDSIPEVHKVLRRLGFAVDQIKVDNEDRPKKSPSAFCFGIRIPQDVRIVYKFTSPGSTLTSVFHEFGHGIHGISGIPPEPPWKRLIVPNSVSETFSILIETLVTSNKLFLTEDLGLPKDAAQDIMDRNNFMYLFFCVFYAANSLMKLAYWKEGLTFPQASQRWQDLTRRFYIEIPGDYWLLHHVMPQYAIYAPSYMIASVRVTHLVRHLTKEFGNRWWHEPRAGKYISELAATRGEFPIKKFSLNPQTYLDRISNLSFL